MKAVKRFKRLLLRKRPELMEGIFGRASRIVQPPLSMQSSSWLRRSKSTDTDDRRPIDTALTSEGVHREIRVSDDLKRLPEGIDHITVLSEEKFDPHSSRLREPTSPPQTTSEKHTSSPTDSKASHRTIHRSETGKGQAHDPLLDVLFLDVGTGTEEKTVGDDQIHVVSESPGAVDVNIYEEAYQQEVQKILEAKGKSATLYLTRRVEDNKEIRENENITDHSNSGAQTPKLGFAKILAAVKENRQNDDEEDGSGADDKS